MSNSGQPKPSTPRTGEAFQFREGGSHESARIAALAEVEKMRDAVRTSVLPLYLVRLGDAAVVEVSAPMAELGERSRSEMLGRSVLELAEWPDQVAWSFELLADGALVALTRRGALRQPDGTLLPLVVHYEGQSGQVSRTYAVGAVLGLDGAGPIERGRQVPLARTAVSLEQRVRRLEGHLRRIAQEIHASEVASTTRHSLDALPEIAALTARERDILARLLAGDRVSVIARDLFLSESTVRNHLTGVFRAFDVGSQGALLERLRSRADRGAG